MTKEKQFRITGTVYGNAVPDRLVADLNEAGWKMTTWHLDEKHHATPSQFNPQLTLPPRVFYSMSNMFAHMDTGEKIVIDDDKIYRLELVDDSVGVAVTCYGIDSIDSVLASFYKSVDDLPDWVQRKLAVLSLFDPKRINKDVENVGRRINKNVFWIYPEEQ